MSWIVTGTKSFDPATPKDLITVPQNPSLSSGDSATPRRRTCSAPTSSISTRAIGSGSSPGPITSLPSNTVMSLTVHRLVLVRSIQGLTEVLREFLQLRFFHR